MSCVSQRNQSFGMGSQKCFWSCAAKKKPWHSHLKWPAALRLKEQRVSHWQVTVIVLGLPQCGHLLLNPETWASLD